MWLLVQVFFFFFFATWSRIWLATQNLQWYNFTLQFQKHSNVYFFFENVWWVILYAIEFFLIYPDKQKMIHRFLLLFLNIVPIFVKIPCWFQRDRDNFWWTVQWHLIGKSCMCTLKLLQSLETKLGKWK